MEWDALVTPETECLRRVSCFMALRPVIDWSYSTQGTRDVGPIFPFRFWDLPEMVGCGSSSASGTRWLGGTEEPVTAGRVVKVFNGLGRILLRRVHKGGRTSPILFRLLSHSLKMSNG